MEKFCVRDTTSEDAVGESYGELIDLIVDGTELSLETCDGGWTKQKSIPYPTEILSHHVPINEKGKSWENDEVLMKRIRQYGDCCSVDEKLAQTIVWRLALYQREMNVKTLGTLPKAYIFDKDGTLLDTESIWFEVYRRLLQQFGVTHDALVHKDLMGLGAKACIVKLQEVFPQLPQGGDATQKLLDERKRLFRLVRAGQGIQFRHGALEFLKRCTYERIPLAIATSATREECEEELEFLEIRQLFKAIITADDVREQKPHPEIYAAAAHALDLQPVNCLAFEDGMNGLESARSSGMRTIFVRDSRFGVQLFPEAVLTIESFLDLFTFDELLKLA